MELSALTTGDETKDGFSLMTRRRQFTELTPSDGVTELPEANIDGTAYKIKLARLTKTFIN
jgi:hypothetical protein